MVASLGNSLIFRLVKSNLFFPVGCKTPRNFGYIQWRQLLAWNQLRSCWRLTVLIRRISTEGCGPFWWFFVGWLAVYQDLHPAMKSRIYISKRPVLRKVGHHWIRSLVDGNAHVSGKRDGPPLKMYYFFGAMCAVWCMIYGPCVLWLAIYDTIYYYPKNTYIILVRGWWSTQ